MWLLFAFSGPVLWAVSTHIDKYLLERYFKSTPVLILLIFTALAGALILPFIWFYKPQVLAVLVEDIAVMLVSGILYMTAMTFYLQALQTEEASTVAPLFQASPLFAFLLGYLFLGETLTPRQIAGALMIVAAAFSLSFGPSLRMEAMNTRLLVLMMACTFVLALSSVIFKIFAVKDEFWTTVFWTYAGEALFGIAVLAIPGYVRQLVSLLRENPAAIAGINAANELINLGAGLGVRYALLFAPLALVSAISSTTPIFVFAFGIALTFTFPSHGREDLSSRNLLRKGAAALLAACGVVLINGA
jgi:drug/metabolite transporter (DMT)-like permease